MEVQPDFKELLRLFNAHGVEYVIVGAYAVARHGAPRYTGDLDIGVGWEAASSGSIAGTFGDVPVRYIGMAELIANKRASGRLKDLADVEALGEQP